MYSLSLKGVIELYYTPITSTCFMYPVQIQNFLKYNKNLVVKFYDSFISFYDFHYQAIITQLLINVEIQVSSDSYVIN